MEMKPLPEIRNVSNMDPRSINLMNPRTLSYGVGDMSMSSAKDQEFADMLQAMKMAYAETNAYRKRSEAIARAKDRQMQQAVER
jgi:hypothetical protein